MKAFCVVLLLMLSTFGITSAPRAQAQAPPMPMPTLRGSRQIIKAENDEADREDLDRIDDRDELNRFVSKHLLVPIPRSQSVHPTMPAYRAYTRPWSARLLQDLAREHDSLLRAFGKPLKPLVVTSAVRPSVDQRKLRKLNRNAASDTGELASLHLTGSALDISWRKMSKAEVRWMRRVSYGLMRTGQGWVTQEYARRCFHIVVYRNYRSMHWKPPRARSDAKNKKHPAVSNGKHPHKK